MILKLSFDDFGYSPVYARGYIYAKVKGKGTPTAVAECINDAIHTYLKKMAHKGKVPIDCIEVVEWDMPRKKKKHGGKKFTFYLHRYRIVSLPRKQVWGYYYATQSTT